MYGGLHVGRSWPPQHHIEDACPCPQEPCGLVSQWAEECTQHNPEHAQTLRQGHSAADCPGGADGRQEEGR